MGRVSFTSRFELLCVRIQNVIIFENEKDFTACATCYAGRYGGVTVRKQTTNWRCYSKKKIIRRSWPKKKISIIVWFTTKNNAQQALHRQKRRHCRIFGKRS